MRKILNIMAIALAIFCRIPVEVHGQSFLKKLKQKVGNVVGTKDAVSYTHLTLPTICSV